MIQHPIRHLHAGRMRPIMKHLDVKWPESYRDNQQFASHRTVFFQSLDESSVEFVGCFFLAIRCFES